MIHFQCPACLKHIAASDKTRGRPGVCGQCGGPVRVPGASTLLPPILPVRPRRASTPATALWSVLFLLVCFGILIAIAVVAVRWANAPGPPIARMLASRVYLDYDDNRVAADAKYLDKTVDLVAEVDRIDRDERGAFLDFIFATPDGLRLGMRCYFDDAATLVRLRPGDAVVVRGVCRGPHPAAGMWMEYRIDVERCRLLEHHPRKSR